MFSGLTEAFFALMLIATVYFFITDRFLLTAIIISFVPFVRSEGLMFVFWFMLLLMFKRQYKTLPFVFLGTFFYSILGGVITGDFLWLINDNPYSASSQIYGHGSLFDYVTSVPSTFGFIVFCLAILGFLTVFAFYFISKFRKEKISNTWFNEFFVIGYSAIGYFLFHSIIWWKGWMSVLGDPRFMAAIVPLMAILALKGFNVCLYPVKKQWLIWTVMLIVSVAMIYFSLKRYLLPVKFQGPDYYVNCALDWMKQNQYDKNKIIYYNVLVPVLIDADPFENERLQSSVPDNMNPEIGVEKNTIVIWDGHFSSLEGQLPLQKMLENSNYKLLKLIEPNPPFKLVRDEDYKVAVFIRK